MRRCSVSLRICRVTICAAADSARCEPNDIHVVCSIAGLMMRTALNSPLQGTAADLIKLAMIAIDRRLREEKFKARMFLQVHDELLFEVPERELSSVRELVCHEMESVHKLDVPLAVEAKAGPNWRDMQ